MTYSSTSRNWHDQRKKRGPRKRRDETLSIVFYQCDLRSDADNALTLYDSELRQVAAQDDHQHCPLPDQKFTDAVQHQDTLLLLPLLWNEGNRLSRHRLADRLGIRRVVLLPLHLA